MKSLGDQFAEKIMLQLKSFKPHGAKLMAERIEKRMHDNVDNGIGFDPNEYQRAYAKRTERERRRGGHQIEYADLQRAKQRVKSTMIEGKPDHAIIKFRSGGKIMHGHNWGQEPSGKKKSRLPRRQLFPDIEGGGKNAKGTGKLKHPNSIPKQFEEEVLKLGTKLMNVPV